MTGAISEHESPYQVAVALTCPATEDAHAVFRALRTAYPSDRKAEDVPEHTPGRRPTVWVASFDAAAVRAKPGPARLTAPVTATLQGGYRAVDSICDTLSAAFAVRVVGTASGDQEEEVQLSLASR